MARLMGTRPIGHCENRSGFMRYSSKLLLIPLTPKQPLKSPWVAVDGSSTDDKPWLDILLRDGRRQLVIGCLCLLYVSFVYHSSRQGPVDGRVGCLRQGGQHHQPDVRHQPVLGAAARHHVVPRETGQFYLYSSDLTAARTFYYPLM